MKKGMGSHHSSASLKDEWLTPPEIVEKLGPFDLDPCSPINRPWDVARMHYTELDNGLMLNWDGLVFMNPPYGKQTGLWMDKLALHGNGIALIFARTETSFFFNSVWDHATSILFIKGRLHFYHVTGEMAKANSGAPSVLIAYGDLADQRLKKSGIKGKYIKLK